MEENGKLKVLSTTSMIGDLVAQVGGEEIDHLCLIVGAIDPHSYELVKGDGEKFDRADLLFHNGLALEHGASLSHRIQGHPSAIAIGEELRALYPDKILWKTTQVDPHIWMDVELWSHAVSVIEEALAQRLPEYGEIFHRRGEALRQECALVHATIQKRMKEIPKDKRYLVTSHDAFYYFTRAYLREEDEQLNWEERFAAPEGLAPEGQISVADIQAVVEFLIAHQVHVMFPESNVSRDALKKIVEVAGNMGLPVRIAERALHGDAMGSKGSDAENYLAMMLHNADVLAAAWQD
jgi:manganese/zinc/iron transport system substrate-binding protein